MKKDKVIYIIVVIFIFTTMVLVLIDRYYGYHAAMHCNYTWGVVVDVNSYEGKSYHAVVQYKVERELFECLIRPISYQHLGDSIVVCYDTTRHKRAFVPKRNSKDSETAFFKSEEKIIGEKWLKNLDKYKNNLSVKQEAHRRREHFYDYFCRDDH